MQSPVLVPVKAEILHALIVKDEGKWYAEALELRLCVRGHTWKDARDKLLEAVKHVLWQSSTSAELGRESKAVVSYRWGSV